LRGDIEKVFMVERCSQEVNRSSSSWGIGVSVVIEDHFWDMV
jgi:hypothetical protein